MATLQERNQQCVQEFLRLCNYMGNDRDLKNALVDALKTEHRTVQQTFCRVVNDTLCEYADIEGEDLRNEAAKEFANRVKNLKAGFPFV